MAVPGSRNKQCELCKSVPRDENAAVWVHTFDQYEAAHGIAHPVRQRSTAEQTQFSTTGTALRKRVPGTDAVLPKRPVSDSSPSP